MHIDRTKLWLWFSCRSIRQGGERFRWHRLIPVGDARQVKVQAVSMPVLDAGSKRFLEPDWVLKMEPINMGSSEPPISRRIISFARSAGSAEVRMHVNLVGAPALVEVILGTSSVGAARPWFAIDQEHVVALAVPNWGVALDVVIHADKVSASGWLAKDVIVFIRRVVLEFAERLPLVLFSSAVFGTGYFLVVPSVEAGSVRGERRMVFVVDVVVEMLNIDVGVVLECDTGALVERHREVADQ